MANNKKKARPTKEHFLPSDYDGRCTGKKNVDWTQSMPTYGRIKELADGEVLHKFEMRLPIPSLDESPNFDAQCQDMFGISGSDLVQKGLDKLKTDLDELFKSILFARVCRDEEGDLFTLAADEDLPEGAEEVWPEVPHPSQAGDSYDPARHVDAQLAVDEWRYTPRAAGKSVTVASFIQEMVSSGRVAAEELEGIETQAQLFTKLAELGIL